MARVTWIGLLAFLPLTVQASETSLADLSDRINQCIDLQFTDDSTPAIFAKINLPEDCPGLARELARHSELSATLSVDQESSNLAELADLRYLVTNIRHPAQGHIELEHTGLQGILDNALRDTPQEKQTSWWKQLIDWLFRRDPGEDDETNLRWLENFLEKLTLSASTARTIFYTSAFLIAALALAMIWREVRLGKAAGWSLFRRRSANTREEDLSSLTNTLSINPDALPASLPALLNICIDHLISKGRLPERKSQTNYEFLRYLQARDDAAAPQFDTLCQQAERVLYGDQHPDLSVVERCLNEAKLLLSAAMPVESTL